MSTASGTATDYSDLLDKLRAFLTTDSTLTSLGQNWTELHHNTTPYTVVDNYVSNTADQETYLKAPGLSGTENIYVQIQAYKNVSGDYYNWRLKGATGYSGGGGFTFFTQPGVSQDHFMLLWDQSIPYWFIANGQRCIVIAKVSTVYEMMYLGKFLPYGTPGQYPYPVAVGGMACNPPPGSWGGPQPQNANLRFSDTSGAHRAFFDGTGFTVCNLDSAWVPFRNFNGSYFENVNTIWPWTFYQTNNRLNMLETNLDGSYTVFPARLQMSSPALNLLGELDGLGFITGFSNSSESDVTVGSDTYKVFQNGYLTAKDNYCAVKWA